METEVVVQYIFQINTMGKQHKPYIFFAVQGKMATLLTLSRHDSVFRPFFR